MTLSHQDIQAILTTAGQPFEIEQLVIDGREVNACKHAPASMAQVLEQSRAHGDKDYIVYRGERLSYAEHVRRQHLRNRYSTGLEEGFCSS